MKKEITERVEERRIKILQDRLDYLVQKPHTSRKNITEIIMLEKKVKNLKRIICLKN